MRAARVSISFQVIAQALHMPANTVLLESETQVSRQTLTLVLAHADLPECQEGADPIEIVPTLTRNGDEVVFDWNLPHGA